MRLLIVFILALSISVACDQPNINIEGYKIGCPFEAKGASQKKNEDTNIEIYVQDLTDPIFDGDRVEIRILNGHIEELLFLKISKNADIINQEEKLMLSSLQNQWGEYQHTKANEITDSYDFHTAEKDTLANINLSKIQNEFAGLIGIKYTSKKIKAYREKSQNTQ